MSQLTDIYVNKEDLGKNLYRKKTYYTLCIEQDCLATNKDEADKLFSDAGINYDNINKDLAEEKGGVETYMVDANYTDSDTTKYIAKVVYDDYDGLENAKENGVIIQYAAQCMQYPGPFIICIFKSPIIFISGTYNCPTICNPFSSF